MHSTAPQEPQPIMSSNNDNDTVSTSTTQPPQSPPTAPPSPSLLTMSTFLTNIIDCVARPSTSDSPIRMHKSIDNNNNSPTCISAFNESKNTLLQYSSSTDPHQEDPHNLSSLDASTRQQFEAAFATFLYKNPAFASISYQNLTRLRRKLAKESAENSAAEKELRRQLTQLREDKARRELELQRELLEVTRAKAVREAELKNAIWRVRCESMRLEGETRRVNKESGDASSGEAVVCQEGSPSNSEKKSFPVGTSPMVPVSPVSTREYTSNPLLLMPLTPEIAVTDSFQEELNKTRMEYERMNLQIEELKQLIENRTLH